MTTTITTAAATAIATTINAIATPIKIALLQAKHWKNVIVWGAAHPKPSLNPTQRVQSTYMVQSMVFVVVISLMVWVSVPHMGTWDPLG